MERRLELDGLRGVAVLSVILFHASFDIFAGGFVGVDIFFVLSGYFIARSIAAQLEVNRFSYVGFLLRRSRRILPALFFMLFLSLPASWFFLYAREMKDFGQSVSSPKECAMNN